MNFTICHELQDLNDSYMKACFLECFTDSVSSVLFFFLKVSVDIVDCSAGGSIKNDYLTQLIFAGENVSVDM